MEVEYTVYRRHSQIGLGAGKLLKSSIQPSGRLHTPHELVAMYLITAHTGANQICHTPRVRGRARVARLDASLIATLGTT